MGCATRSDPHIRLPLRRDSRLNSTTQTSLGSCRCDRARSIIHLHGRSHLKITKGKGWRKADSYVGWVFAGAGSNEFRSRRRF